MAKLDGIWSPQGVHLHDGDKVLASIGEDTISGKLLVPSSGSLCYIVHNQPVRSGQAPSKMPEGYKYSWAFNVMGPGHFSDYVHSIEPLNSMDPDEPSGIVLLRTRGRLQFAPGVD